jgi:diguanylate cyclase (GGDEF)-like protein
MDNTASLPTDTLTKTYIHSVFRKQFKEALDKAIQNDEPISLAYVDVDKFKQINDTHGHDIGDEVLKLLAKHLMESVADQGIVARYGGEEFIILLPGMEKEQAFLLFEGIRKDIHKEHQFTANDQLATLTLATSVGISSFPDDGHVEQDLIRKAIDALYRAKMTGRNKVCLAREERMVTKTSHYTQGQLERLSILAKREGMGEAVLLREALDDLLRKYDV